MGKKPDLVVSGINFGENFGTGVTISGTVGAAMEGAAMDIPSIAVSLETHKSFHITYSKDVDFTTAADVTRRFASLLLEKELPPDVDLLKIEVPTEATLETPWELTRLSKLRYYESLPPNRKDLTEPGRLDYHVAANIEDFPPDSDVYITRVAKKIAVTALSLDFTSRISLEALDGSIRPHLDK
jgi:5'-nucleotidase